MKMQRLIRAALAMLVVLVAPAWAETITLSGNVTYRERIALPADTWLRVSLVRLDDLQPVLGAHARIPARGQVPIAYVLNIHSDVDIFSGAYGLMAEISQDGQVLFHNPVPAPVIDTDAPDIVVNYAPGPKAGAASPVVEDIDLVAPAPDLVDILWTVTSIGGRPVIAPRPPSLSIAADHRAGGFGGCNNYFTEASLKADALTFGPAAATRMACVPDVMEQEAAYFAALAAVASYELDEQGLRLLDAAGVPLIGLVRATE